MKPWPASPVLYVPQPALNLQGRPQDLLDTSTPRSARARDFMRQLLPGARRHLCPRPLHNGFFLQTDAPFLLGTHAQVSVTTAPTRTLNRFREALSAACAEAVLSAGGRHRDPRRAWTCDHGTVPALENWSATPERRSDPDLHQARSPPLLGPLHRAVSLGTATAVIFPPCTGFVVEPWGCRMIRRFRLWRLLPASGGKDLCTAGR